MKTIQRDDADIIVAGGAEASILPVIFAGFINMRALSGRNDDPKAASRPFDAGRDGFVISEGAGGAGPRGSSDTPSARGAVISTRRSWATAAATTRGTWFNRVTRAPARQRSCARHCATRRYATAACVSDVEIGYINAHGTSTPYNDRFETAAIKDVFGEHAAHLAVSSTKSMTGHMFGRPRAPWRPSSASSRSRTGWLPPTINYATPDPECDLDYVPNKARQWTPTAAMSNSFGLGGQQRNRRLPRVFRIRRH